jgi:hypothetical protein
MRPLDKSVLAVLVSPRSRAALARSRSVAKLLMPAT